MKKITLVVPLLLTMVFPGCGQKAFDQQLRLLLKKTISLIQPAQLAAELQQGSPLLLLDTRSLAEYEVSHLPQAKLVDYATFSLNSVKNIALDTPIIVYCAVGVRSERIGEKLQQAGFTNVRNLYGGIFQWKNQGYPVVDQRNVPTEMVHTYNRYWAIWLSKGIKVYE